MNIQSAAGEATLPSRRFNDRALVFHEVPALEKTARDALENHRVGTLSRCLLGAALGLVLCSAVVYLLAVSPYLIGVLGPLFQAH